MKIGVLDDDNTTRQIIEQALKDGESTLGYPTYRFFSRGHDMLEAVKSEVFDCLILDRQLPDMSGDVILQWVRQYSMKQFNHYTTIIMLTHLRTESDELQSLRAGADDYLTKPFRPAILLERIYRLIELRKNISPAAVGATLSATGSDNSSFMQEIDAEDLSIMGYQFHAFDRTVELPSGESVTLSRLESDLGRFFFKNAGLRLSRESIVDNVWHKHGDASTRALDTHIHKLRVKLKLTTENGFDLRTIYGYGYCLYVAK